MGLGARVRVRGRRRGEVYLQTYICTDHYKGYGV